MAAGNSIVTIEPWPLVVEENTAVGTVVATVTVSDPDGVATSAVGLQVMSSPYFTIERTSATTGNLVVKGPIDYEALESGTINIDIRIRDTGSPATFDIHPFTISISDQLNEGDQPPHSVTLTKAVDRTDNGVAANSIGEDFIVGNAIATVSAVDPEGGALSYTLDPSSSDKFELQMRGGVATLVLKSAVDYETATTHTIIINVQDEAGNITQKTQEIGIVNVNEVSGPQLSADSVAENAAVGTVVGTLEATNAAGLPVTYSIVNIAGNPVANAFFTVVGNELRVAGGLDFETLASHKLSIKASAGADSVISDFTINVTDVNEAPIDIALDLFRPVTEADRTGAVIGTLSATDPEGDAITWSLPTLNTGSNLTQDQRNENNTLSTFKLVENEDGTVGVRLLKPLDYEQGTSNGLLGNGQYALVVIATDKQGNQTKHTLYVQAEDEHVKFTGAPTGKDYAGVVENVEAGTELGYVKSFDGSFTPVSVELTDDAGGMFEIRSRLVGSETRYYVVTNGVIDYEAEVSHSITVKATDSSGISHEKTIDIKVIDAAEAGDTARGTITIDADTALMAQDGGVNWDTYLDEMYARTTGGLPAGVTFAPATSSEYVYNTSSDGTLISLKGNDLTYWWTDPVTGEDVHVVGGTVTELTFGNGTYAGNVAEVSDKALSITGLDVSNGSGLMERIYGEANAFAAAWMHGANNADNPAEIAFVKAVLASYAQTFKGSAGADTFTGSIFNDTINGNGGNDVLSGGLGNDKIDGGAGTDTAVYAGKSTDYALKLSADGKTLTVTDKRMSEVNEGIDTLTGVERLQFSDRTIDTPVNAAPTGLSLSSTAVKENVAVGTTVGTLSAKDPEGKALTYTLTDNAGGLFKLSGNKLVTAKAVDYETVKSGKVTVAVSDGVNKVAKTFTIGVQDVNEAPTSLALSKSSVKENVAVGTTVGTLSAKDPEGKTLSYKLTDNAGGLFKLDGNKLVTAKAVDYEAVKSGKVTLAVSDGVNTTSKTFTIGVQDVNEAPTSLALSGTSVKENVAVGTTVGTLSAKDPEGKTLTYTLTDNAGGLFKLDGNKLVTAKAVDYEAVKSGKVTVAVSDGVNKVAKTFTIGVQDVNEVDKAPTSLSLSATTVKENVKTGTTVGTFSAKDPEGRTLTYKLTDTAGGLFKLSGTKLVTARAVDYEKVQKDAVTVAASDGVNTVSKIFTITVADRVETIAGTAKAETLKGGLGADLIKGGAGNDTL
ncbi:cadherin domain-containing protein, partial [Rhizobium subbaraonis]